MAALQELAITLPHFGMPAEVAESTLAALDAAGYDVIAQGEPEGSSPTPVLETAEARRVLIRGMPNAWLAGVQVGERGWFVWMEQLDKEGGFTKTQPVFCAGGGQLLTRPLTSGKWTVGTSAIGGTDKVR